ncbi:MAG: UDP-N-acetylmuramate dehydrogenase [Gammaproteobacteria bacterium]|nr:UDP-N-acetylmuramate dehydrogenase [Gammaproteobacteria bacterium]
MPRARTNTGLRGTLRLNEPLSRHTSWRVGGPADHYYEPADLDDLAQFLKTVPNHEPIHWIGLGSNLLVRDGGVRGTVVCVTGRLSGLELSTGHRVRAEAGVPCAKLARFCVRHELSGAEFLAGIPGTVGGALAMNAGAFGGETWRIVVAVETIDRQGKIRTRPPVDYRVSYRSVVGPDQEWFVAGIFELAAGVATEGKSLIRSLLAKRGATQPTQQANAGSVFRNPVGDHAARLIEAAGLKGVCEGDACVSDIHANFIINRGTATAAQIERLIAIVHERVLAVHNVNLEREVRIMGVEA